MQAAYRSIHKQTVTKPQHNFNQSKIKVTPVISPLRPLPLATNTDVLCIQTATK